MYSSPTNYIHNDVQLNSHISQHFFSQGFALWHNNEPIININMHFSTESPHCMQAFFDISRITQWQKLPVFAKFAWISWKIKNNLEQLHNNIFRKYTEKSRCLIIRLFHSGEGVLLIILITISALHTYFNVLLLW